MNKNKICEFNDLARNIFFSHKKEFINSTRFKRAKEEEVKVGLSCVQKNKKNIFKSLLTALNAQ